MIKIDEINRVHLGIRGENAARDIEIDMSEWAEEHPEADVEIWHRRSGDTEAALTGATYDADTQVLTWTPDSTDTYAAGRGIAEVVMTDTGLVKKKQFLTTVHDGMQIIDTD